MTVRITRPELCNAIRVSSTSAAVIDEINRLLRWATATVERHAPEAPDEMHDMAAVLLVGRAYDRPLASRGTAHSNIMRQSGAGTVLMPWRKMVAGHVAEAEHPADIPTARDRAIAAHDAALVSHPYILGEISGIADPLTPGALQAQLWVPNAELKRLDTDYIELIPAPGAGRYIELSQVWMQKHGSDMPPTHVEYYRLGISPNAVITEAEALLVAGRGDTFGDMPIPDWDTPHYFYAGTSVTNQDVTSVDGLPAADFATQFQRVPGSIDVDGLAIKWWRTVDTYDNRLALFRGRATTRVRRNFAAPITERIGSYMAFALLFPSSNPAGPFPLANEDKTTAVGYTYHDVLTADDAQIFSYGIGGHTLLGDTALQFGGAFQLAEQYRDSYYTTAVHDVYLAPVDDVALGLTVRYRIHDTAAPPMGP